MRTDRRPRILAMAIPVVLLASACGPDEQMPGTPPGPHAVAIEPSPDATKPPAPQAPPAQRCLEAATREDWAAALGPCTRAAREHPEDEAVRQALEHAIAASEEPLE